MKKILQVLGAASVLCLGFVAGCHSEPAKSTMMIASPLLGDAPKSVPKAAPKPLGLEAASRSKPGARLTVSGTMVDKCPTSGCWFHLRDGSGTLRVELKTAGFSVAEVPLQSEVTVSGVVSKSGGETVLQASGLHYGSTSLP